MEKLKKNKMILIIGGVVILAIIVLLVMVMNKDGGFGSSVKSLKCSIDNTLIEGFNNKEDFTITMGDNDKIKRIKYNRVVTLSDIYKEDATYLDSLNTSLENAYSYLKNYKVDKNNDNVKVSFDIKNQGIILNNLTIKKNSEVEDTSLRFDALNDIEKDKNAFKVGDKYSSSDLKSKIESIGYKCN